MLESIVPEKNQLNISFSSSGDSANLLEKSYSSGFVGAFSDNAKVDCPDWAKRAARYLDDEFLADTPGSVKLFSDVAPSLANGDGECHINCRHALELWEAGGRKGVMPYTAAQDFGSCVDASATEHTTGLLGWRASKSEYNEEYRHAVAWYWYSLRGFCSDGWSGSGIATVARRLGVAFRILYDIGGNTVDLTDDDDNERIMARQWCRTGPPNWLSTHTATNHPFQDGAITQFRDGGKAEIKKALAAGGAIHHSGTRTSGGSKPFTIGSTGPHMQSAVGYDDSDEFRRFCQDVIGVPSRSDDFPVVSHQTWGAGWKGECADQYWPSWWGSKPEGAWVWWASDLINKISLDYVWLPWVKGFPASTPIPVNQPEIGGALYAEQVVGTLIAIRGELSLSIPAGQPVGDYRYIVAPDGTGKYKVVPKSIL